MPRLAPPPGREKSPELKPRPEDALVPARELPCKPLAARSSPGMPRPAPDEKSAADATALAALPVPFACSGAIVLPGAEASCPPEERISVGEEPPARATLPAGVGDATRAMLPAARACSGDRLDPVALASCPPEERISVGAMPPARATLAAVGALVRAPLCTPRTGSDDEPEPLA
jgi:hypothetical protein